MMGRDSTDLTLEMLNEEVRMIWDANAPFWASYMGAEGNSFHRLLVAPSAERLLALQTGEEVLEIACGGGLFARQMAHLGARVVATDFSSVFLELARERVAEFEEQVQFAQVDATHEEEIVALGEQRFDAAVCNMGIMDMAEIDPLMHGLAQVLKPGGRFVFTIMHPCFNSSHVTMGVETRDESGEVITERFLKKTKYLYMEPEKGIGIVGQPLPQYYFHRPLHKLLGRAFRVGFTMDGIEEPAFGGIEEPKARVHWPDFHEFPPVLAVRLRLA